MKTITGGTYRIQLQHRKGGASKFYTLEINGHMFLALSYREAVTIGNDWAKRLGWLS